MVKEIATQVGMESSTSHQFKHIDPDIVGYVEEREEQGEHATVYGVERVEETEAAVEYLRCKGERCETDGASETFQVDAKTTTTEVAGEFIYDEPDEAIRLAREYWE